MISLLLPNKGKLTAVSVSDPKSNKLSVLNEEFNHHVGEKITNSMGSQNFYIHFASGLDLVSKIIFILNNPRDILLKLDQSHMK